MMSLTFGLFTQVSGSGPLGPLVLNKPQYNAFHIYDNNAFGTENLVNLVNRDLFLLIQNIIQEKIPIHFTL